MARKHGLTRREFVKGAAVAAVGGPLALAAAGEEAPSAQAFKTPAAEAFGWRLGKIGRASCRERVSRHV